MGDQSQFPIFHFQNIFSFIMATPFSPKLYFDFSPYTKRSLIFGLEYQNVKLSHQPKTKW